MACRSNNLLLLVTINDIHLEMKKNIFFWSHNKNNVIQIHFLSKSNLYISGEMFEKFVILV